MHSLCFAQIQSRRLKIYSITEYIDGYVIKGIDTSKGDTLNLISIKEADKIGKSHIEKMMVGKEYNFEYEDRMNNVAAIAPNSLVIKIKTTVVWKDSDENKNRPVFARNTKGLWIEQ